MIRLILLFFLLYAPIYAEDVTKPTFKLLRTLTGKAYVTVRDKLEAQAGSKPEDTLLRRIVHVRKKYPDLVTYLESFALSKQSKDMDSDEYWAADKELITRANRHLRYRNRKKKTYLPSFIDIFNPRTNTVAKYVKQEGVAEMFEAMVALELEYLWKDPYEIPENIRMAYGYNWLYATTQPAMLYGGKMSMALGAKFKRPVDSVIFQRWLREIVDDNNSPLGILIAPLTRKHGVNRLKKAASGTDENAVMALLLSSLHFKLASANTLPTDWTFIGERFTNLTLEQCNLMQKILLKGERKSQISLHSFALFARIRADVVKREFVVKVNEYAESCMTHFCRGYDSSLLRLPITALTWPLGKEEIIDKAMNNPKVDHAKQEFWKKLRPMLKRRTSRLPTVQQLIQFELLYSELVKSIWTAPGKRK